MQNENELYNVQFWSYTIQKGELKEKAKKQKKKAFIIIKHEMRGHFWK